VIFGLAAALGWGSADYAGAVAGRRIGALPTVVIGQLLSASFMTVLVVATGQDIARASTFIGLLALNGVFTAFAYTTHYKALELGPVAVVSPIGGAYAVVGIALAIAINGEDPGAVALAGAAVTVAGVVLVSTDIPAFRAGVRGGAPGLWWSIVAAISFGIAAFLLGTAAQEMGWVLGLWGSRVAQVSCYAPLVALRRRDFATLRTSGARTGVVVALAAGAADILGVTTYSAGAEAGFLSIVLAASAVFPMVAVFLSIAFLHERLAANQWLGLLFVVIGLVLLGYGAQ
jgi:drug/metabolite transporter (DMT)-like permease